MVKGAASREIKSGLGSSLAHRVWIFDLRGRVRRFEDVSALSARIPSKRFTELRVVSHLHKSF